MIIGFIIWTVVSFIFVVIGISCLRAKEPVGFFTFAKPPIVADIKKYNKAVAILWFVFALLLEFLGLPFLFCEQNSPVFIVIVLGAFLLVIAIIISYIFIEKKYRV